LEPSATVDPEDAILALEWPHAQVSAARANRGRQKMKRTDDLPARAYELVVRLKIRNVPGMLAKVAAAIGTAGGSIGAIDAPEITTKTVIRDITISVLDDEHGRRVVEAITEVADVRVLSVSNAIFLAHLGDQDFVFVIMEDMLSPTPAATPPASPPPQ